MLQVTQNIGSKYAYDMLILCVQISVMQNVSFEAVVSFVSFEAAVQRCSFK